MPKPSGLLPSWPPESWPVFYRISHRLLCAATARRRRPGSPVPGRRRVRPPLPLRPFDFLLGKRKFQGFVFPRIRIQGLDSKDSIFKDSISRIRPQGFDLQGFQSQGFVCRSPPLPAGADLPRTKGWYRARRGPRIRFFKEKLNLKDSSSRIRFSRIQSQPSGCRFWPMRPPRCRRSARAWSARSSRIRNSPRFQGFIFKDSISRIRIPEIFFSGKTRSQGFDRLKPASSRLKRTERIRFFKDSIFKDSSRNSKLARIHFQGLDFKDSIVLSRALNRPRATRSDGRARRPRNGPMPEARLSTTFLPPSCVLVRARRRPPASRTIRCEACSWPCAG
jgi:hypothetical protein